jgi:hypothetical protein
MNHWVFLKREVNEQGEEILYVSDWIDRSEARLFWATVVLASLDGSEVPLGERGTIPQWVRTARPTTQTVLGVPSISQLPPTSILASTPKAHTVRVMVNGLDVVAKLVDSPQQRLGCFVRPRTNRGDGVREAAGGARRSHSPLLLPRKRFQPNLGRSRDLVRESFLFIPGRDYR